MVDLARVVEVMLDHGYDDDPSGLSHLASVKRSSAESLVVRNHLAAAYVADDVTDRARAAWRHPGPVLGCDRVQVAEEGVPIWPIKTSIHQVEIVFDRLCRHVLSFRVSSPYQAQSHGLCLERRVRTYLEYSTISGRSASAFVTAWAVRRTGGTLNGQADHLLA